MVHNIEYVCVCVCTVRGTSCIEMKFHSVVEKERKTQRNERMYVCWMCVPSSSKRHGYAIYILAFSAGRKWVAK